MQSRVECVRGVGGGAGGNGRVRRSGGVIGANAQSDGFQGPRSRAEDEVKRQKGMR